MSKAVPYAQATYSDGCWHLSENSVWNLPAEGDALHLEVKHGPFPFASIASIRGVAISKRGKVFGIRTLSNIREDGYAHIGRVSLGGKSYRAFTDSRLFKRSDGTFINVREIYVQGYDDHELHVIEKAVALTPEQVLAGINERWVCRTCENCGNYPQYKNSVYRHAFMDNETWIYHLSGFLGDHTPMFIQEPIAQPEPQTTRNGEYQ